jgi:hypothetical protein
MNMKTSSVILILTVLSVPASASPIIQSVFSRQGAHDTSYTPYQQFDPKLGTLTLVTLDFTSGFANTNSWSFTSTLPVTTTATVTIHSFATYGDHTLDLTRSFVDTFSPGQSVSHQVSDTFSGQTIYTSGLDRFIGTGTLIPDTYIGGLFGFATSSVPGIGSFSDQLAQITFNEKITYTYLTPSEAAAAVPEPSSLLLWGVGLVGLCGGRVSYPRRG